MARIRTIKPEFFRHLDLYNAEQETKLPLRLAYAGLWTACDREGRFRWVPQELKLDCLPYDNVDFSRVLDALWYRGFIEKYTSQGRFFGFVPSWNDHQHINNRETESIIPSPSESDILTREGHDNDASTKFQRGREGKGRERKGKEFAPPSLDDVKNYFKENGYKEEIAIKAFNHYAVANWHDSQGSPVLNWKQKIQTNWFEDKNKIGVNGSNMLIPS